MGKNVLFLAPKVANIYLDIITELKRQGYEVDYYEYKSYKLDPHYLKGYVKYGKVFSSKLISSYFIKRDWTKLLASEPYNKVYDYLFVIDGYSLHPCLFESLRKRNTHIKTINYLFDSTYSNYEFNVHFPYFDKVATFDLSDSKKYAINLLPIYWPLLKNEYVSQDIDMFGLGSDVGQRFQLFSSLNDYSNKYNLRSFIKIYLKPVDNISKYKLKYKIVETLSSKSVMVPPFHFSSPIVTNQSLSTSDYMHMIMRSKIVIDSNAPHQDGLTARFMWALGAGRKIITTNKAVRQYDFYTPEQIYVVEDIEGLISNSHFDNFVQSDFKMQNNIRSKIETYRIDKWLCCLFA